MPRMNAKVRPSLCIVRMIVSTRYMFAMKKSFTKSLTLCLAIATAALCPACTTIKYKDGTSEFTRTSFGTNLQIMELKASTAPNGDRTITLQGYTSDQVEALRAVAEGVAKGFSMGVK
jgi:hypothetical protein